MTTLQFSLIMMFYFALASKFEAMREKATQAAGVLQMRSRRK